MRLGMPQDPPLPARPGLDVDAVLQPYVPRPWESVRCGSRRSRANGAGARTPPTELVSRSSTAARSSARRYCHMIECHTTVTCPGDNSIPRRNATASSRRTSAGTCRAIASAPRNRSSRSAMSGQTYDVSVSAPSSVNGFTGAISHPTRSAIRSSTAGTGPVHAGSNTTGLSSGPYDVPSATYRNCRPAGSIHRSHRSRTAAPAAAAHRPGATDRRTARLPGRPRSSAAAASAATCISPDRDCSTCSNASHPSTGSQTPPTLG